MASSNRPSLLLRLLRCAAILLNIAMFSASSHLSQDQQASSTEREKREEYLGRRVLISFKETANGGNMTFDCSPSGPCVPCAYSEKNDEKYHCSETGYRIPLKCVEIRAGSKETEGKKTKNSRSILESNKVESLPTDDHIASVRHRSLLDNSSTADGGAESYITYRSCTTPNNEEKLSVLGFEGIVLFLLTVSGAVVYLRRKRTFAMPGVGALRVPTNSRF